jgi:hypothetical protein
LNLKDEKLERREDTQTTGKGACRERGEGDDRRLMKTSQIWKKRREEKTGKKRGKGWNECLCACVCGVKRVRRQGVTIG